MATMYPGGTKGFYDKPGKPKPIKNVLTRPTPKPKPKSTGFRTAVLVDMTGKKTTVTTPRTPGDDRPIVPYGNRSGGGLLGPAGKLVNSVYKTY